MLRTIRFFSLLECPLPQKFKWDLLPGSSHQVLPMRMRKEVPLGILWAVESPLRMTDHGQEPSWMVRPSWRTW